MASSTSAAAVSARALGFQDLHAFRAVLAVFAAAFENQEAYASNPVIVVQADYGDDAAISLYTKLGVREE